MEAILSNVWNNSLEYYTSIDTVSDLRKQQADIISRVIDINSLDRIEIIETGASQNFSDGCFGLFLAHLAEERGGKFSSVDLEENILSKSINIYKEMLPNLEVSSFLEDSVEFLRRYNGKPTIVHLDSYDLNIYDPEHSMLHGFLEFLEIKDKMDSGSYIIVDDNFMRGTCIYWNIYQNGELKETKEYNVEQEILGKGSMIYHYCRKDNSEWEIMADMLEEGPLRWKNQKLILRKK